MSDNDQNTQHPDQRKLQIHKIYLKDVSFETPNSPDIFSEQKWEPDVSFELRNTAKKLNDPFHEVVLAVTVTAKLGDKVAYLAEVQQAGIFSLEGYTDEQLAEMVGGYCPGILFPFVREAVTDLVTKGSFPQLLLAPVNFLALYQQHIVRQKQEGTHKKATH
jgi:preprotein translocase subunit SecB